MPVRKPCFWCLVLAWLCLVPSLATASEELASDARIHKKFSLLPGKASDRYVLYIPFEVTRPGRIRVYHEITGMDLKVDFSAALPDYILVDARALEGINTPLWKQLIRDMVDMYPPLKLEVEAMRILIDGVKDVLRIKEDKPKWFHGARGLLDKGGNPLTHDVDERDLRITEGRYVLILRNPTRGEYHGNILISYPGDAWLVEPALEAGNPRKPDLAVERIDLDADNRVLVTVANRGPGWLHRVRYNPNAEQVIRLSLELDGREVASIPLATLDKQYALSLNGGTVTYRTEVLLSKPARVSAVIDADGVVAEMDEGNNRKRETLAPRPAPELSAEPGRRVKRGAQAETSETGAPALPDLTVADVLTDARKRVVVRLLNQGAGPIAEDGLAGQPIQVRVLFNGRGWANVPLAMVDPQGALKQPGGSVLWTSDLVLPEAGEVTVIVDEANRCAESDEANNTLVRRLPR